MESGIYQIRNSANGKRYISSSINTKRRWRHHLVALRRNCHKNGRLQRAFEQYGEEAFVFSILEDTKDEALIEREQHYLDLLCPEYNIVRTAGSTLGYQFSLEARRKISKALTGRRLSAEHCKALSDALKGRKLSEEHCRKISEAKKGKPSPLKGMKGKPFSKEHRRNISRALRGKRSGMYGKHHSKATRAKLSAAMSGERHPNYGKHLSEETRRRISVANRGQCRSTKTRRNISEARKGTHHSEETRRKISEANKAHWRRVHATQGRDRVKGTGDS